MAFYQFHFPFKSSVDLILWIVIVMIL